MTTPLSLQVTLLIFSCTWATGLAQEPPGVNSTLCPADTCKDLIKRMIFCPRPASIYTVYNPERQMCSVRTGCPIKDPPAGMLSWHGCLDACKECIPPENLKPKGRQTTTKKPDRKRRRRGAVELSETAAQRQKREVSPEVEKREAEPQPEKRDAERHLEKREADQQPEKREAPSEVGKRGAQAQPDKREAPPTPVRKRELRG